MWKIIIFIILLLQSLPGQEFAGISDIFTVDSRVDGSYEPPAFSNQSLSFTVDSRVDGIYEPPAFSNQSLPFTVDSRVDGIYEPPAFSNQSLPFTVDSRVDGIFEPPAFSSQSLPFTVDSRVDGDFDQPFVVLTPAFIVDNIPPTIEVLDPNGGEVITETSAYPVTWTANDPSLDMSPVSLLISVMNGGDYYVLEQNIANDVPEFVQLPFMNTYAARIKAVATDRFGNSNSDTSDDLFTVLGYREGYSRIYGWITESETGQPLENVQLQVYPAGSGSSAITNENGAYQMFLPYGSGYELTISRTGYETIDELAFDISEPEINLNHTLYPYGTLYDSYRIRPVSWLPNPDTLKVPEGGSAYAWFQAEGRVGNVWVPVPDAMLVYRDDQNTIRFAGSNLLPYHFLLTPYHFSTPGLVALPVLWDYIENGEETFTVISVNGYNVPVQNRQSIVAKMVPFEYTQDWGYRLYSQSSLQDWNGPAQSTGYAGGGSGATIRLNWEENATGTEWNRLTLYRRDDLFSGFDLPIGPPALINVGIDASAGGLFSFPYEQEYTVERSQLTGLRAALTVFLFIEPMVLYSDAPTMTQLSTSFMTWLAEVLLENLNDTDLESMRTADRAGLDVSVSTEVSMQLGIGDSPPVFTLQTDPSLGNDVHIGGSLRRTGDNLIEKTIYVGGGYDSQAFLGPAMVSELSQTAGLLYPFRFSQPDLPSSLNVAYGITGTWQEDNWQTVTVSASIESDSPGLNYYDLGGQLQEYESWFGISDVTVLTELLNTGSLPSAMWDIGSAPVSAVMNNEVFSNGIEEFIDGISTLQVSDPAYTLSYGITGREESAVSIAPELDFPLPAQPSLHIGFGNGIVAAVDKEFPFARGYWVQGLPYLQAEVSSPPQSEENFSEVFSQLWTEIISGDVWEALAAVIESRIQTTVIAPATVRDNQVFLLNDRGSRLDMSSGALPASTDSILCRFWDWGTGSRDGSLDMDKRLKLEQYTDGLREIREQAAGLHYGLGGFFSLEPAGLVFSDSTLLTIVYADSEVVDLDENALALYYEDATGNWHPLLSNVNPDSNTVTALIPACRTYTIAPRLPQGSFTLSVVPDSLPADGVSLATVTSGVILNNDSTLVADGALLTVNISRGTLVTPDADPEEPGTQVSAIGGTLSFQLRADSLASPVQIVATSQEGYAQGFLELPLFDVSLPDTPTLFEVSTHADGLHLVWEESTSPDLAGYYIWFDSDTSGAPYEGTATVWGESSPVQTGLTTHQTLTGLTDGETYYIAITAYDISGAESAYSNEMSIIMTPYETGDVNQDGNINVTDVVQLVWIILNDLQLSDLELSLADMTHDGQVNISDIVELVYIILSHIGREEN